MTPVKFGISFNLTAFNQAGALVHVYKDGSVLINHGGAEMGQGLHTKMIQVAATALGRAAGLRPAGPDPDRQGAQHLGDRGQLGRGHQRRRDQERLRPDPGAARTSSPAASSASTPTTCGSSTAWSPASAFTTSRSPWAELVHDAYYQRVQLWAAGFLPHRGAALGRQPDAGRAVQVLRLRRRVSEVEVDGFTGAYRLRRVDIVHDVGDSLSPLIDIGQIEGGFVQGAGWLTLEELRWDDSDGPNRGRLNTQAASTYKIPSFSEMPEEFNVHLFERATESGVVYGSKAVGEPPLMQAFSVREALRQAVGAFGPAGWSVDLGCPSTPEAVYWAIEAARCRGRRRERLCRSTSGRTSCAGGVSAMDWLSAVEPAAPGGFPGVLVTVIKVRGHAPRDAGAKMVVGADHSWGSVGGGNLEEAAVRRARELIAGGGAASSARS